MRRGGVSAFGFGGTNFHAVLEEHVPGRHAPPARAFAGASVATGRHPSPRRARPTVGSGRSGKAPLRGAAVLGGTRRRRRCSPSDALARRGPGRSSAGACSRPTARWSAAPARRVAIDYADAADLATKARQGGQGADQRTTRRSAGCFAHQGVFVGRGAGARRSRSSTPARARSTSTCSRSCAPTNRSSRARSDEADRVMTPLLGKPLTRLHLRRRRRRRPPSSRLEQQLLQTEITQPAVLATDSAISRLLAAYGDRARHGDGPQPRRVRRAGRRRLAHLRRCARSGQRPRPRDGAPLGRRQRRDGGRVRAARRDRADRRREADGYVVVANINSQQPGRHRRCHRRGRWPRSTRSSAAGMHGDADPGQPCVPHRRSSRRRSGR